MNEVHIVYDVQQSTNIHGRPVRSEAGCRVETGEDYRKDVVQFEAQSNNARGSNGQAGDKQADDQQQLRLELVNYGGTKLATKRAASQDFIGLFKNRVEVTPSATAQMDQNSRNICYQTIRVQNDTPAKKSQFLMLKALEMKLDHRQTAIIIKQLDLHEHGQITVSREVLFDRILDQILLHDLSHQKDVDQQPIEGSSQQHQQSITMNKLATAQIIPQLDCVNLVFSLEIQQQVQRPAENEDRLLQADRSGQTFECDICLGSHRLAQTSQLSDRCIHRFCAGCLEKYLMQRLWEGRVTHIQCPQAGCDNLLTDKDVQKILPRKIFSQYTKIRKNSHIDSNPQVRYCTRGTCESYIKFNIGQKTEKCEYCKYRTCFECYRPAHNGETCEYSINKEIERLLHAFRDGKCPSCAFEIDLEQSNISNSVQCPSCQLEFCWLCKHKVTRWHYSFWNVCYGCPNMRLTVVGSGEAAKRVKIQNCARGWLRFFHFNLMVFFMLCGYIISLIVIPALLPLGVFFYYKYDTYQKKSLLSQWFIGMVLLVIGIFGFVIWLALCLFPGIIIAIRKIGKIALQRFQPLEL